MKLRDLSHMWMHEYRSMKNFLQRKGNKVKSRWIVFDSYHDRGIDDYNILGLGLTTNATVIYTSCYSKVSYQMEM